MPFSNLYFVNSKLFSPAPFDHNPFFSRFRPLPASHLHHTGTHLFTHLECVCLWIPKTIRVVQNVRFSNSVSISVSNLVSNSVSPLKTGPPVEPSVQPGDEHSHCQWNLSWKKNPKFSTRKKKPKILGVRKLKLFSILSVTRLLIWTRTLWRPQ